MNALRLALCARGARRSAEAAGDAAEAIDERSLTEAVSLIDEAIGRLQTVKDRLRAAIGGAV